MVMTISRPMVPPKWIGVESLREIHGDPDLENELLNNHRMFMFVKCLQLVLLRLSIDFKADCLSTYQ
jgi:hypothetical protein